MSKRKVKPLGPLRLKIEPVVGVAEALTERVRAELPTHDGLATAAGGVAAAAQQAERVSQSMKSPFSPHRLPAIFLAAALLCLAAWLYWRFFYVATLTIANVVHKYFFIICLLFGLLVICCPALSLAIRRPEASCRRRN